MDIKNLRGLAKKIVLESEGYSSFAKDQILNFIEETNSTNIKGFILDGEIKNLNESSDVKEVVDARFSNFLTSISKNIKESSEFFDLSRDVISNYLESLELEESKTQEMIDYVMCEASEYQILGTLIEGNMPEQYDPNHEVELLESLNSIAGTSFITEGSALAVIPGNKAHDVNKLGTAARRAGAHAKKLMNIGHNAKVYARRGAYKVANKVDRTAWKSKTKAKSVLKNIKGDKKKAAGNLAIAAIVAYAAYRLYKRLTSATANCHGDQACVKRVRTQAIKAQISKLKSGMSSCSQAKNPDKCKAALNTKISKLQSRLSKI